MENPDITCRPLMQQKYPIFSDCAIFQQVWEPPQSFFLDKLVTIGLRYPRFGNSLLARPGRAEAVSTSSVSGARGVDQAHRTNRITSRMSVVVELWLTREEIW